MRFKCVLHRDKVGNWMWGVVALPPHDQVNNNSINEHGLSIYSLSQHSSERSSQLDINILNPVFPPVILIVRLRRKVFRKRCILIPI